MVRSIERRNAAEVMHLERLIEQTESYIDLWRRRSKEGPAGPTKNGGQY